MEKLPISAVVVCYNEEALLTRCLTSLYFCDEIIVIDLFSTDKSYQKAQELGAKIIQKERQPYVEYFQAWISDKTKHDWILYIDPDEVVDSSLSQEISDNFGQIDPTICQLKLPWRFYFKNKPLRGTVWGGEKYKGILVHRKRIIIQAVSQMKFRYLEGYKALKLNLAKDNVIHHYWMTSFSSFFEKHRRYIKEEGAARFKTGERYDRRKHSIEVLKSFYFSFYVKKGYRDGLLGLLLSLFWVWYVNGSWNSLRRYRPG